MGLTRLEALQILGLEEGCSEKEIRDRFKKLALKWHPDKNFHNPDEAQKKFQVISAAYSKLVSKEEDEVTITLGDIFSDFHRYYNPHAHVFCDCDICQDEWSGMDFADLMGSDSDMFSDDDEGIFSSSHADDRYYADQLLRAFAERLYRNFNGPSRMARKARETAWEESRYNRKSNISAEEASRNADELLKAEEKEKEEAEKKKQKNKKKREAKKKKKAKRQRDKDDGGTSSQGSKSKEQSKGEMEDLGQGNDEEPSDLDDDEIDIMSAFVARASKKNSQQQQQQQAPAYHCGTVEVEVEEDEMPSSSSTTTTKIKGTFSHIYEEEEKENVVPESDGRERVANGSSNGAASATSTTSEMMARSRQLAALGNIAAKDGHFSEAVRRFTEAIDLYPFDHRYFGNRSFCYDYLQEYSCALDDASAALRLDTSWPKGYYRQGRAFAGLKRFEEAEASYVKALQLDPNYKDAEEELFKIRLEQLKAMGFTSTLSELALKEYKTVQAAIDAILVGKVTSLEIDDHTHVYAPEERLAPPTGAQKRPPPSPSPPQESSGGYTPTYNHMGYQIPPRMMNHQPSPRHTHQMPPRHAHQTPPRLGGQPQASKQHQTAKGSLKQQQTPKQQQASKQQTHKHSPPQNKHESTVDINSQGKALWVGNIGSSSITEGVIKKLFQQFGEIHSVRLIRERRCAFVNFASPQSAAEAMKQLQGKNVDGSYLLIRYPENSFLAPTSSSNSAADGSSKKAGSANVKECYHWRTNGCLFGSKCRYRHVPSHKGVDLKD